MLKKYVELLDVEFDRTDSWSELVKKLVEKFHITPDYADKMIDAYIAE